MKKIDEGIIRDFCAKHGMEFDREEDEPAKGRKIIYLKECPFNSSHTGGDARFLISSKGVCSFKCHHDSCKDKKLPDVFKKFEPDFFKDTIVSTKDGKTVPAQEIQPLSLITAAELDKMVLPPIRWIVKDVLPTGLAMLGAPSKYFKSYMALDLCSSVCNGADFLGRQTVKGSCLYFDLESSKRRPQKRLKQILGDQLKPDNLLIHAGLTGVQKIGNGFEDQIRQTLIEHPDIKLIVIDVLQKIRPAAKFKQNGYDRDYDDMTVLQQLAIENDVCILLIHHTRKMKDDSDVFNELSGSVGIMGALDTAWVISKKSRKEKDAILHITGRDIESVDLGIEFDPRSMRWKCNGTTEEIEAKKLADDYRNSPIIATIKKLVSQNGGTWTGSAADIESASHYFGTPIYTDLQHIGNEIGRFEAMLYYDGISTDRDRGGKKRKYIFKLRCH